MTKKLLEAGRDMHAGAAGLFALLDKIDTNEEGLMRRPNYIGTCHAADGEKIWAAIDLLKSGMARWAKAEAKEAAK
jgi:hypothetical protein